MTSDNGWITWAPKPTKAMRYPFTDPVSPDTLVQVRLNTGDRILNSRPARDYNWQNIAGRDRITAYRICQPPAHKEPTK